VWMTENDHTKHVFLYFTPRHKALRKQQTREHYTPFASFHTMRCAHFWVRFKIKTTWIMIYTLRN